MRKECEPKVLFKEMMRAMSILIVEDDLSFRRQLGKTLSPLFGAVEMASDGASGLLAYKKRGGFDLVMTDFSMPGKSGAALIRAVQKDRPEQKCILITAHPNEAEVKEVFYGNAHVLVIAKQRLKVGIVEEDLAFWNPVFLFVCDVHNRQSQSAPRLTSFAR